MTDALAAFLKARLDEDEQTATAPSSAVWASPEWRFTDGDDGPFVDLGTNQLAEESGLNAAELEHIARQDPARTLREVEAKRALLAEYGTAVAAREEASTVLQKTRASGWDPIMAELEEASAIHKRDALLRVLRLLAAVYADHPDYLPEWRP